MYNNNENGQNSVATSAPLYFDCGLNSSERHIVYDELTPEKLSAWFKATEHRFPLQIMGQDNLTAWVRKENGKLNFEEGDFILSIYRYDREKCEALDEWKLRIGEHITKSDWNTIVKFVEDYVSGTLEEKYHWIPEVDRWNKEYRLALA